MDIRILTLLLFISVTATFAELRSPFFRPRRDGLQENYRPLALEFAAAPRTKRESSNTTKGTTVPMSTANPSTVPLPDSKSIFSKKTDPTTEPNMSDSNESTSSPTPDSTSTTGITPEPSPKTASPPTSVPRNKRKPTTSEAEPTTPQPIDQSTEPEATSLGSTTTSTANPTARPIITKTTSPTSNPTTTPTTAPTTTPTPAPTTSPTTAPNTSPITTQSTSPSTTPNTNPTTTPSTSPSTTPNTSPSTTPSTSPSTTPSTSPTTTPSTSPTTPPSTSPTTTPSTNPTATQTTESSKPKPKRTTPNPITESVTAKSETTSPSPTSTPRTSNPTTKPTTSMTTTPRAKSNSNATPATTTVTPSKATTDPQTQTSPNSKKTDPPASTTAVPSFGSRFNLDDDIPVSGKSPTDAIQGPTTNPDLMPSVNEGPVEGYPAFPISPFIPFFVPNFVPDFAFPSNPYSDPTFNSIPAVGNKNAWTEPSNGAGFAPSFASASASAGADDNSNYNPAPLTYGGGFAEQPIADTVPATAVEPNVANVADTMPNLPGVAVAGGYGYGGDVPFFDPNSFAFPGYDMNNFQKQMMDNFQQLQNQFQRQQQAIFEAGNRIGAPDGFGGQGPHTAFSSINLGPRGGYQSGAINPATPGIQSRFGETLPAPSGNSYSVFSSSSSRTQVGPDGKTVSHKSSTTGVNDNGQITFRTVRD